MKKIIFVLPSLKAGGAERVISHISQKLDHNKFSVILMVIGFEEDSVYNIDDVKTIFLNKKRLLTGIPAITRHIIKFRPDIVVSAIGHVNIFMGFLSMFFRKIYFVGREASVLSVMKNYSGIQNKFYQSLVRIFYNRLNKIVCQSEDMAVDLRSNFNIDSRKLVIINNPITIQSHFKRKDFDNSKAVQFVTVGRMSSEKGYERILAVLATITSYDFHYTIIGDGPLKNDILNLAEKLGLKSRITHIPYTSDILEILSQMDVFLQGSFVEGFPNAVLESCSVGTPVIAFDAPGGTKEIIENGISGFIVKDHIDFTKLLANKSLILSINSAPVAAGILSKFNSSKIIGEYESLFDSF
jgi:glycosyltransferase involved in cell wall biosynthesis